MASKLYHDPCPVCNGDIEAGDRAFLFGLDMNEVPPVSIFAHRACLEARCWRGFVVVGKGQAMGEILEPSPSTNSLEYTNGRSAEAETLPLFG